MKSRKSSKPSKTPVNWLDLPRDVTIQIFLKLNVIQLLCSVQRVCSSWRAIAEDPQLYQVIDMSNPWPYFTEDDDDSFASVRKLAILAIGRSHGQLVEFSMNYYCTDKIMYQLANKSPLLKCLRITNGVFVNNDCMIQVFEKLHFLEEVELLFAFQICQVIEALGRFCPKLKLFGLNGPRGNFLPVLNEEAFAIVGNVNPGLRSLRLVRNSMNNEGLEAILERFTQLEYLDIRQCDNVDLEGDLLSKCRGIKTLRLPNDSANDYPLDWEEDDDDHDYFGWS